MSSSTKVLRVGSKRWRDDFVQVESVAMLHVKMNQCFPIVHWLMQGTTNATVTSK